MPEIPRWARQKWGDYQGKWHLAYADGRLLCPSPVQDGALYLPRVEWRAHFGGMPCKGKVCRRCEAIWQAEHEVLSVPPAKDPPECESAGIAHLRNEEHD